MCKWGLGSEPVASGEVIACRRPIAVSVGWEEDGEERVGERSADLCFFLWDVYEILCVRVCVSVCVSMGLCMLEQRLDVLSLLCVGCP